MPGMNRLFARHRCVTMIPLLASMKALCSVRMIPNIRKCVPSSQHPIGCHLGLSQAT